MLASGSLGISAGPGPVLIALHRSHPVLAPRGTRTCSGLLLPPLPLLWGLGALSQEECGHKGGEQSTKEEAQEQEQAVSAGASSRLALPVPSWRRAEWRSESSWVHCAELEGPSLLYCLGWAGSNPHICLLD